MRENAAKLLVEEMKAAGVDLVVCLPDSGFKQVYFLCRDDPDFDFIPVTNEGEGVAIAAGAWFGGKRALMFMENSGLRAASEALARLSIGYDIPVLILLSHRGSFGDGNWWSETHAVVMEPMLKALRIPYRILESEDEIEGSIQKAFKNLFATKHHVALVIGGGLLW